VPADQQNVLGLDIAVDDALGVGGAQCIGDLPWRAGSHPRSELLLAADPVPEGFALDEGHDVVEDPGVAAEWPESNSGRICGCWRWAATSISRGTARADRRGQLRSEHLHGHEAVVLEIFGQIDGRHPTGAELARRRY